MTQPDYDQKKRECFVKFCKDNGIDQEVNISIFDAFDQIFDRAYALGREKETITQVEIESHSVEYATDVNNARLSACPEAIRPQLYPEYEMDDLANAFEAGANFALGKQFGNSEQVDAEGEEILTVSRKRVREMYAANERIKADFPDKETAHISNHINHTLKHLFGFKCLPDNIATSAPNVDSSHGNIDSLSQNPPENCNSENHISTDDSKPAEPTDFGREVNFPTKNNPTIYLKKSKNCDNRLQIAAMAMQGILSNIDLFKNVLETGTETLSGDGISYRAVAKASLLFADALIAESEKRSGHGK